MNNVKQILKSKGYRIVEVSIDATVLEALKRMAENNIGSVIVMDGDKIAGIFTERDYAHKVGVLDVAPSTIKVSDVMTQALITVGMDVTVNECMEIITDNKVRHLPVIDDDHIVGVVSIGDVVKDMIDELQFVVKQLENYITYFR
jgi:CBS domain-containing protein